MPALSLLQDAASLNEAHEQGVRMQHRRAVFSVELGTYVPLLLRNLYYLYQICGGIDTHALHTVLLVFLLVLVVELITMTVALLYTLTIDH